MELAFLGGATTVTGSQFLLDTSDARVLVDCGMFQGSPNETVRNRLPFAYDPHDVDALLLTHAHLDHCGLIPPPRRERLPRLDQRDRRDDGARRTRPAGRGQASDGVREAGRAAGAPPPSLAS